MRKLFVLLLAAMLLSLALPTMAQGGGTARLRVVHLGNNAPTVDVFIDGQARSFVRDLEAFNTTGWITLRAGVHTFSVSLGGRSIVLVEEFEYTLEADSTVNLVIVGEARTLGIDVQMIAEEYEDLGDATARVTIFHGIPDGPIVDLRSDGEVFLGRLGYPGTITLVGGGTNDGVTTVDLRAGTYDFSITPNGLAAPVILDLSGTTLEGGQAYFIAAAGTAAAPRVVVASAALP